MRILTRQKSLYIYALGDLVVSIAIWLYTNTSFTGVSLEQFLGESSRAYMYWFKLLTIPIFWILFYLFMDEYQDPYRKSRFRTLSRTFLHTGMGIFILFVLDMFSADLVESRGVFYYFLFHFIGIGFVRILHLTIVHDQVQKGIVSFNTLIIGSNEKALNLYRDVVNRKESLGYNIIGFININGPVESGLSDVLPELGNSDDIEKVIKENNVEEALVAIEKDEYSKIRKIMDGLFDIPRGLTIKIIPDLYDILLGKVRMNYVYGAILIEIEREIMPRWQRIIKRVFDILVSIIFIVLFWWVYVYIAIRVKLSSRGPVFYKQTRIGLEGKPFTIFKFRSMYVGSEKKGPQLSFEGDERCTPWGAIMRKWRIDELPQFWNVLKGEMSLVGPRPERSFFIEKIMERAPHYKHLLRIKPGITSWGQVKYGYASTVDEMLQRLKYDILYVENRSFALDLKILFYTVLVLVKGSGR
ncbi:sugar transferase [Membranihabitans maritimus]|uniref:sugar transferase n=1 Tax=Membranihabitans maritimus TaxID=2904244 RepID=UPI001F2F15E1|nr:sugar transferase [Membranihabitans maritimus]